MDIFYKLKREKYNPDLYSIDFTKHLLAQLYDFITTEQVESLNYFSDYDKAGLLNALEHLENFSKLKNYVEDNEFEMYEQFRQLFPNGLK
jgi:hypothetical protein